MQDVARRIWMIMIFLLATAKDSIETTSNFTIMDAGMVSELLTSLRREARKQGLDFDDSSALDDTDYYRQFNSLTQYSIR